MSMIVLTSIFFTHPGAGALYLGTASGTFIPRLSVGFRAGLWRLRGVGAVAFRYGCECVTLLPVSHKNAIARRLEKRPPRRARGRRKTRESNVPSGNIVERLRAMAADLDQFRRDKVEDELSEAADVIERLRAELDRMEARLAGTQTAAADSSAASQ
ncbi:hypothetical protein [Ancylobacter polymorphus]|uniref:Uncharacterized protein n=1 Tax=Ancylobacter polymorphus TaxID=223390 RepID=A0ABU0B752_9HYPH|nr:hypothetical protein [Ancylobacter polymorphus]MDQ0301650.1 hypothetical protein [Ancylobacter polymorphus]